MQRGSLLRSVLYLGQLHAERRDLDLPQPPQGLQSERRGAAGQELDERQEVEVIITDEELQQDVQGAGENAVRNGHGYPQQPALEHVHGALPVTLTRQSAESPISAGGLCPLQTGLERTGPGGFGFTRNCGALLPDRGAGAKEGREAVRSPRFRRQCGRKSVHPGAFSTTKSEFQLHLLKKYIKTESFFLIVDAHSSSPAAGDLTGDFFFFALLSQKEKKKTISIRETQRGEKK